MADADAEATLPTRTSSEPDDDTEARTTGDVEQNQTVNDKAAAAGNSLPTDESVVLVGDIGEPNNRGCEENDNGTTDVEGKKDGGEHGEPGGSIDHERAPKYGGEREASEGGTSCVGGADDDKLYRRIQDLALRVINAARETRWLGPLSMDTALVVPAMTHCRTMCDHGFLSHWDIAGRKPYQRYSDFAYGQHVSEMVFGFDMDEATEDKISSKIKECIEGRMGPEKIEEGAANSNHLLDAMHTHIGIGVYAAGNKLRYVEVYADRYLELLDAPVELSVGNTASGFQISVQMTSSDVGPYACLVFHDPVATPLTVGELQQQFSGPYSDFSPTQVGIVWPWQMERVAEGVFDIPIPVSPIKPGTYYVQILVRGDPDGIPYDATYPTDGFPLPGDSFCGGSLVLRAPEETGGDIGISDLDGEWGLLADSGSGTLEEREARTMASTTALRRDLAPISRVKVVQEIGGGTTQDNSYEKTIFIPAERAEDMAQLHLGVYFLRLGAWDDRSSLADTTSIVDNASDNVDASEIGKEAGTKREDGATVGEPPAGSSDAAPDGSKAPAESLAAVEDETNESANAQDDGGGRDEAKDGNGEEGSDAAKGTDHDHAPAQPEGEGSAENKVGLIATVEKSERSTSLVVAEIAVATFKDSEKVEPPEGFEFLPGDLAGPFPVNDETVSDGGILEQTGGEVADGNVEEGDTRGGEDKGDMDTHSRDKVFLCVKMVEHTDVVSPLTDLALVYGTESFQMGFGFVTIALPQAVNELYGSSLYLCYKKAGASLAVIQQLAERTAEKTAKQIQQHLGIEGDDGDGKDDPIEDEEYDIDADMTPEQMLEWEKKRNREAAERADRREQVERDRKRKEASEAVQRRIEEALKEQEELVKQNSEWQKKIASLMLTQQKTREEARAEHGGRGVEKEATPVHESEKHYAESLASIVSCRERMQEQQGEYDTVAISLQTRLDEKEYKSREIADSFRDFKREIARTAEHSRTGKTIPKGVISQFEAAEAKKDEEIEKVRLKNINLRMMLKKVEGNLRAKEQLAEGLHLIDFEQLKIENQTVNEKIEERNEELLKLRKKNTTTVQILTHTKEKLQFVAAENAVTSNQLSGLEEDLNQERDCLTRAKKDRDNLRTEVASLRQIQGFANSDLLILDFDQRKSHLKKLGQKLEEMRSKHHLLLLEQERLQESNEQRTHELEGMEL